MDDKGSGFGSHREIFSAPRFNRAAILFPTGRRQRGKTGRHFKTSQPHGKMRPLNVIKPRNSNEVSYKSCPRRRSRYFLHDKARDISLPSNFVVKTAAHRVIALTSSQTHSTTPIHAQKFIIKLFNSSTDSID